MPIEISSVGILGGGVMGSGGIENGGQNC